MKETTKTTTKGGVQKIRRKPGRVPTSCAECRRLKLRCDKQVPCEKCVQRGCASICPTGSLTPGKGNRLILANTEELHERIDQLSSRIRELEDALRTLQSSVSDDPHPLLLEPSILPPLQSTSSTGHHPTLSDTTNTAPASGSIAHSLSLPSAPSSPPPPMTLPPSPMAEGGDDEENEPRPIAAGTLVLGANTRSIYLGSTTRAEFLVEANDLPTKSPKYDFSWLPKSLLDTIFWESQISDHVLEDQIFKMLPSLSEALALCEVYQEYGKFLYTPVPRKILFDDVLSSVYRASFTQIQSHHKLALLFIIFAIGAHFDPKREPFSVKSQEYYCLARTAMKFDARPTLLGVQVQIHIAQYLDFCEHDSSGSHLGWMVVGHAYRAGQSIGLNTNPSSWNLSPPSVQRRRHLFWQLFHLDTWASFCFGRPPLLSSKYIDCPLPEDEDSDEAHPIVPSFHSWSWQFTPLLQRVLEGVIGTKSIKYSTVLSLDKEIRDFAIPDGWRASTENWGLLDPSQESSGVNSGLLNMQRWFVLTYKETAIMNLHRAYFAQALAESPSNLSTHPYLPSICAVFRSAWRILNGLRFMWKYARSILLRTPQPWSHGLSAAVVLCIYVTKASGTRLARSAVHELDLVNGLFQEAATVCRPAASFLNTMTRLCRKAHEVADRPRSRMADAALSVLADHELDRWGGKTRVQARPDSSEEVQGGPIPSHSGSFSYIPPNSGSSASSFSNNSSMHPSLLQDIRNFDMGRFTMTFFDLPASSPSQQLSSHLPPLLLSHDSIASTSGSSFSGHVHHTIVSQPQPHQPHHPLGTPVAIGVGGHSSFMGGGFEHSPPALDSTWQSFVEQLGF